jgi:hypothetical protein
MLTENKEDYNDESVYQPEPVDLGVEDVAAQGTNKICFSMMRRLLSRRSMYAQIHIPSQCPRNVGVHPADTIAEPQLTINSF